MKIFLFITLVSLFVFASGATIKPTELELEKCHMRLSTIIDKLCQRPVFEIPSSASDIIKGKYNRTEIIKQCCLNACSPFDLKLACTSNSEEEPTPTPTLKTPTPIVINREKHISELQVQLCGIRLAQYVRNICREPEIEAGVSEFKRNRAEILMQSCCLKPCSIAELQQKACSSELEEDEPTSTTPPSPKFKYLRWLLPSKKPLTNTALSNSFSNNIDAPIISEPSYSRRTRISGPFISDSLETVETESATTVSQLTPTEPTEVTTKDNKNYLTDFEDEDEDVFGTGSATTTSTYKTAPFRYIPRSVMNTIRGQHTVYAF